MTGPTVVIPLLQHVRPSGAVGHVARWEGILSDPVGALAAVLVFEAILAGEVAGQAGEAGATFLTAALVAALIGVAAAAVMVAALKFIWVPEGLDAYFALSLWWPHSWPRTATRPSPVCWR